MNTVISLNIFNLLIVRTTIQKKIKQFWGYIPSRYEILHVNTLWGEANNLTLIH